MPCSREAAILRAPKVSRHYSRAEVSSLLNLLEFSGIIVSMIGSSDEEKSSAFLRLVASISSSLIPKLSSTTSQEPQLISNTENHHSHRVSVFTTTQQGVSSIFL